MGHVPPVMSHRAAATAIVQARMSSTRLPGKTLADLHGEPLLELLLRRLRRAVTVAEVIVATSLDPGDDAIAALAADLGAGVSRGSRDDVLGRMLGALGDRQGEVVRITADCPLIDPRVLDATVERFRATPGCQYASNIQPRRFPDGLDVEVIDADALRAIAREPLDDHRREHVTTAIRARPERFRQASLVGEQDLGELRWTVDEPEDLEFVRKVVGRLGDGRYRAGLAETLAAVRAPPSLAAFHGRRG